MSFESGRRLLGDGGTRRAPVAVDVREMVECVLRATERTDAAEERTGSRTLAARERAVLRVECKLTVSESSSLDTGPFRILRRLPRAVEVGIVGRMRSVGSLMSSSDRLVSTKAYGVKYGTHLCRSPLPPTARVARTRPLA